MTNKSLQPDRRGVREHGAPSTRRDDLDGDVIRLFQRFRIMVPIVSGGSLIVGILCLVWAFYVLVVDGRPEMHRLGVIAAVCGFFLIPMFAWMLIGWRSINQRKPRWVIASDRLAFVENESDEMAEVRFEEIAGVEIWKFAGTPHVEVLTRRPLDWGRNLPRRFFPVVRITPSGNWAIIVNTTKESPATIIGLIRARLAAFHTARRPSNPPQTSESSFRGE